MKFNNKGFTLIELLLSIVILAILMVSFTIIVSNTFGLTDEQAYEVLKKSIIKQTNQYITECDNNLIDCNNDYLWDSVGDIKKTSFKLGVFRKYSYFNEEKYINPITEEDISNCLIINVTKDRYSKVDILLDDNDCEK